MPLHSMAPEGFRRRPDFLAERSRVPLAIQWNTLRTLDQTDLACKRGHNDARLKQRKLNDLEAFVGTHRRLLIVA